MFRYYLISASAVAMIAALPVHAGSLEDTMVEAEVMAATPISVWDGVYAGLHAGLGSSEFINFDDSEDNDDAWWGEDNYGGTFSGAVGGATVGYNVTRGNLLYGVEGMLGFGAIEGSEIDDVSIAAHPDSSETGDITRPTTNVDIRSYAAVAGRIGMIRDNTLIYGKLGYGAMKADVAFEDRGYSAGDECCGISNASDMLNLSGAVFGAGVEYAFRPNMTVKAEFLRFAVGDETAMPIAYDGDSDEYVAIVEIEDVNMLMIGVNWRF